MRELLDTCEIYSCARVCRAIAMCLADFGSCLLKVMMTGGSSLSVTNWAISARVFTLVVLVLLITTGIILMSAFNRP